jgi:2-keto-4-pentenoate hydratase
MILTLDRDPNHPEGRISMNSFDPGPAGALLAAAWRSGEQIAELPEAVRPRMLAEGYDIQARLLAELGHPIVGWKLGGGSPNAKRQSGLARSVVGAIVEPRLHQAGDAVPVPAGAVVTVEFEIAFVLGRDVRPEETHELPPDLVAATHVAYELVLSRFVDRSRVGSAAIVADNSVSHAVVLGEEIDLARFEDIRRSLVVSANGNEAARGVDGDDLVDPVAALRELLDHARERGITLHAGDVVVTGTLSVPFEVAGPSDAIVARYLNSELGCRVGP